MSTFKKITILVVMLFVTSTSFAQINKGWDGTKPEVWKGSRAFVFMYTPFQSNLGSINAGSSSTFIDTSFSGETSFAGIGAQFFLSPNWALTAALNFGSRSDEATFPAGGTNKISETTLGIAIDFDYHMMSLYSTSPYIGLNANFGMYNRKVTPSGVGTSTTEDKGTGIGAGLNMGFDWYFTPGMSLGGKYTLGFRSNSAPERTTAGSTLSTTVKGPSSTMIGTGIMSVLLKVHF